MVLSLFIRVISTLVCESVQAVGGLEFEIPESMVLLFNFPLEFWRICTQNSLKLGK